MGICPSQDFNNSVKLPKSESNTFSVSLQTKIFGIFLILENWKTYAIILRLL